MRANYAIADEDRPFIRFKRTINRGMKPRQEKRSKGRDGKERVRLASPGAVEQIWDKALIGQVGRGHQEPYSWVTKDWVVSQIKPDCTPIEVCNLDKLPANYPAEWKMKILEAVSAVKGHVLANQKLVEAEAKIAHAEARVAAAEAKVVESEKKASGKTKAE